IAAADTAQTRHDLQQVMRLLALVLLPIVALVIATARQVLTLTFPPAYGRAAPILQVLILAYCAYTVYITLVTALLAENRPRRALAVPLALLPLSALAIWWGVARLGAIGAALASLVAVTTAAALVTAYVFRRFRPAAGPLARSLLRIGLAAAAVWGLARLWTPEGLLLIPAYGLLGGLYLLLLLALGELRLQDLAEVRDWLPASMKRREG
ncbi:MAG: polysaccharide biosynthesis C-terminal domain-containing protein, partial [Anaerolineae bacterium]